MNFIKKLFLIFLWLSFCSFVDFEYKNIVTNEPLSIHIIEVNPKKYQIKPTLAKDKEISRETVLNIAKKHKAKAAINGGFFEIGHPIDGLPRGILKIEGNWIAFPYKQRAAIGWNKTCETFLIDILDVKSYITINEVDYPIDGINRPRKKNERILYFPNFYKLYCTDPTNLTSFMVMSNDCFLATNTSDFLTNILRPNSFNFTTHIVPSLSKDKLNVWDKLDNIVGGAPVLIFNGEKIEDYSIEKICDKFLTEKHARTAIGVKENGNLIFLSVDGNDPNYSLGMTIDQLRDFLYDLGCKYALNLDGGGSTTMVIDNNVVNHTLNCEDEDMENSKKVSDAILILEKKD